MGLRVGPATVRYCRLPYDLHSACVVQKVRALVVGNPTLASMWAGNLPKEKRAEWTQLGTLSIARSSARTFCSSIDTASFSEHHGCALDE